MVSAYTSVNAQTYYDDPDAFTSVNNDGTYCVQIGAFFHIDEQKLKELDGLGGKVYYTKQTHGDKLAKIVAVGNFSGKSTAEAVLEQVKAMGYEEAFVNLYKPNHTMTYVDFSNINATPVTSNEIETINTITDEELTLDEETYGDDESYGSNAYDNAYEKAIEVKKNVDEGHTNQVANVTKQVLDDVIEEPKTTTVDEVADKSHWLDRNTYQKETNYETENDEVFDENIAETTGSSTYPARTFIAQPTYNSNVVSNKEVPEVESNTTLYMVQIGAYKNLASTSFAKVKHIGTLYAEEVNGLNKVLIGTYLSKKEATDALAQAKDKGYKGFVRNITFPGIVTEGDLYYLNQSYNLLQFTKID